MVSNEPGRQNVTAAPTNCLGANADSVPEGKPPSLPYTQRLWPLKYLEHGPSNCRTDVATNGAAS